MLLQNSLGKLSGFRLARAPFLPDWHLQEPCSGLKPVPGQIVSASMEALQSGSLGELDLLAESSAKPLQAFAAMARLPDSE
jgi:hypothetical protein